jgi:membrane protein implicated in regulation of membrane protease activity
MERTPSMRMGRKAVGMFWLGVGMLVVAVVTAFLGAPRFVLILFLVLMLLCAVVGFSLTVAYLRMGKREVEQILRGDDRPH